MWRITSFLLSCVCLSSTLVQAQDYPEGRYTAVQRFLTRPDIEILGWKVTVYDEAALAPGYWFVSPYEVNGLMVPNGSWVGPHIFDNKGELVWSGSGVFDHINVMDFKVVNLGGDDVLSMTYAVKGSAYLLNRDYTVNQTIDIGQTQNRYNMHDFFTTDNGSRFLYLKRNISHASAELTKQDLGYDGTCSVTFPEFEERDAKTGEVTHFWDATGKIPLSDSTMAFAPVEQRCSGGMWDYLHSNAIDKFADGNYLISTRHSDTIYKISKDDGSIIWRLHGQGGDMSDFEMIDLNFTRQHHVKIREQNDTHTIISFLDNAKGADPQPASTPWSRGIIAAIREDTMQAEMIAHYDHPHQGHSFRRGSMQPLPNGNIFMGWSEQALHSEHTPDGKLIMEAELIERKLGSYRSFKFELDADPVDPPDVYSNASSSGDKTTTSIYVSWNGATKVSNWTFYKANPNGGQVEMLGTVDRSGFETKFDHDGYAKFVFAQAKDASGKTLRESTAIETEAKDVSNNALSEEMTWLRNTDSRGWLKKMVWNPITTFVGGVFCGIMIILVLLVARKRRWFGWGANRGPKYAQVSVADAHDYDETMLDDLGRSRSYRDKMYGSDEDEGP